MFLWVGTAITNDIILETHDKKPNQTGLNQNICKHLNKASSTPQCTTWASLDTTPPEDTTPGDNYQGSSRLSVRARCVFFESKILQSGSVRFKKNINLAMRFDGVFTYSKYHGAVRCCEISYSVVGCGLQKNISYGAVHCSFQILEILRCGSVL